MENDVEIAAGRYRPEELRALATALFERAGLAGDRASCVARLLVEADLLGHTTHGLALAPGYLQAIAAGSMAVAGDPEVLSDRGAGVLWDGRGLLGLWLTDQAVALATERARSHGLCTVSIRRSHHIGCLAVFLEHAARAGFMVSVASSDPAMASVAPFGGSAPVMTPNPLAVGIPTDGDPILIDVSMSITTNGMSDRLRKAGSRYPGAWAIDAAGNATDDPAVLWADPPGTILPLGGLEYGHKGYALALMVEALTQGLAGFGRADGPTEWGASVWVQVIDPVAFGGLDAFQRQTGWLAQACRDNAPPPGGGKVRLPGEQGLARKRAADADGVALYPTILDALAPWVAKLGVPPPVPIPPPPAGASPPGAE